MTQQSQPMSPDEYLAQRLDDQIHWYDRKSQQNQKYFKRLRMIEGSSGKWGGGDVVGTFRIPNPLPVRLSI